MKSNIFMRAYHAVSLAVVSVLCGLITLFLMYFTSLIGSSVVGGFNKENTLLLFGNTVHAPWFVFVVGLVVIVTTIFAIFFFVDALLNDYGK